MNEETSLKILYKVCELTKGDTLKSHFAKYRIILGWNEKENVPACFVKDILIDEKLLKKIDYILSHYNRDADDFLEDNLDSMEKIVSSVHNKKVDDSIKDSKVIDFIDDVIDRFDRESKEAKSQKIVKESIKRTNIGFPSEFTAKTESDDNVYIHFRYGDVTIKINDVQIIHEPLDPFCTLGYLSDENLEIILKRNNLL